MTRRGIVNRKQSSGADVTLLYSAAAVLGCLLHSGAGEHCLSPREILLPISLLQFELFCTWLIHLARAGEPWTIFS